MYGFNASGSYYTGTTTILLLRHYYLKMQNAKIVFIVRLAEAIDLGYASQHQFVQRVSKILNHPFMFPLTAHVEVLGVYKQGIVALKGKT